MKLAASGFLEVGGRGVGVGGGLDPLPLTSWEEGPGAAFWGLLRWRLLEGAFLSQ